MSLIARLQARFPSIVLNPVTSAAANSEHTPRDVLLALVDNSIKLLSDANHTVVVRGAARKPFVCYSLKQGAAIVALSYSRAKLVMGADAAGVEAKDIAVDANSLPEVLAMLRDEVVAGVYDAQLATIKSKRVAAQKAGHLAKAA